MHFGNAPLDPGSKVEYNHIKSPVSRTIATNRTAFLPQHNPDNYNYHIQKIPNETTYQSNHTPLFCIPTRLYGPLIVAALILRRNLCRLYDSHNAKRQTAEQSCKNRINQVIIWTSLASIIWCWTWWRCRRRLRIVQSVSAIRAKGSSISNLRTAFRTKTHTLIIFMKD